jgi:4-hydroxy 2-oxovalerate aldolase
MARKVRLIDSTLRDGSHAMAHQFTSEQVRAIVKALDEAGIDTLEISHGDGLGGSSFNYGFSKEPEMDLLKVAAETVTKSKLAVLLLPGIGTREHLKEAREYGVQVARIATHCTEADIALQHIGYAKELGMEAIGFLMMSHMTSPQELLFQGRLMQSYGADAVYVTDSAGALTPDGFRERVRMLREGLDVEIGVHAHNNLGTSVANSLAAVEEGATIVDGCCAGLGAGAGNTPLEIIAAVFDREGIDIGGVDWYKLVDATDKTVRPIMPRPQTIDGPALTLGYAGVYSSFMLHAERAAQRFGVDTRDILLECGKRKLVGGQEDTMIEIAQELSLRAKAGAN